MTKAGIVQLLYERVNGLSKREAATHVDEVFDLLKETLGSGEHVKVTGFGRFALRDKRARPGRDPRTGKPITITERRVVTFKPSLLLRAALSPFGEEARVKPVPPRPAAPARR